ncbi:hypothetical protein [Salinibacter ruber]
MPRNATPVWGDLDGDGRTDLVVGGKRGGLVLYEAVHSR